jgi:hypothetical protein
LDITRFIILYSSHVSSGPRIIHVVQDQDTIPIVHIYPCINLTVIATILSGYNRRYCKTKRLAPGEKREREEKKYLHCNSYCLAQKDRVPRVYAKP